MRPRFDDLPLTSITRFQTHIAVVATQIQTELDRLHNTYPRRFAKVYVDASEVCRVAPHLFSLGQVYVGSYGHGIDCPAAHPEIITETFRLFEDVCLNGRAQVGMHGGVSSGKSSVLNLFRVLLVPLCAVSQQPYVPQLIHSKFQSAITTSRDIAAAFLELYGGIRFVCPETSFTIASFTHDLERAFGKAAVQPVVSLDEMLRLKAAYAQYGLQTIALCDDAHRLGQFDSVREKLQWGPTVESIFRTFDHTIVTTNRPEWLPLTCGVRMLMRSPHYASTHPWYRGEQRADTSTRVIDRGAFAQMMASDKPDLNGQCLDAIRWSETAGIGAAYFRVVDPDDAARLQEALPQAGIEAILCDGRMERSAVSDWCWHAYRHGRRFAIIASGTSPFFHRALPPSVGLFLDTSREGSSRGIERGLCASACGYERGSALVVLSNPNAIAVRQDNLAHRRYHLVGSVRLHQNSSIAAKINYLAHLDDAGWTNDVEIDDLLRTVQQHGRLRVMMYHPN